MPPKKDAKAEKERTTKLLIVLGVVMGLVIIVNYKRISKMFGGSKRRGPAARRLATPRSRGGRARSAPSRGGRRRGGSSVSPDDIPTLDVQVKKRLKNLRSRRPDVVSAEKLLYQTDNPFLPIGVTRKDLDRKARASTSGQGVVAPDALFFRGIMQVGDARYAIIERPDRKVPWYVQEGEMLEGTNFQLKNIAPDESQVSILNPDAKRERDRIKTVPYSGLELTKELGNTLAQVDPETAKVLEAASKGATIPEKGKAPDTQPSDDDMLELFE